MIGIVEPTVAHLGEEKMEQAIQPVLDEPRGRKPPYAVVLAVEALQKVLVHRVKIECIKKESRRGAGSRLKVNIFVGG
jgi:hypothetical protein